MFASIPNGPAVLSLLNGTPLVVVQRQGDWTLVAPGCNLAPTGLWSFGPWRSVERLFVMEGSRLAIIAAGAQGGSNARAPAYLGPANLVLVSLKPTALSPQRSEREPAHAT